ncbi:hypothetical protein LOD99_16264 [Oopsacas minuta]|uniref:Uncharacterized protein n=1 Tax=Oopsacas minuta TaxID=111878 RepID=A0AAV7K6I6_9METZ|nr:hypothetical protein LOD99_16264 [Oopsacas minuta]
MESLSVTTDDHIFTISTHPTTPLIAVGDITGRVSCYSPSGDGDKKMIENISIQEHSKACRALCFSLKGDKLYSASKDKHILSINPISGQILSDVLLAIKSPINVMLYLSDRLVCGHDSGTVSVYNSADLSCIGSLVITEQNEYVSGICHTPSHRQVVVTTGEGQIAIIDIRDIIVKKKFYSNSEILCVCCISGEKKCVTGDTEGKLQFFSWLDNPLQPYAHVTCVSDSSIDSCLALPQGELLCVGCGDGVIRIVNMLLRQVTGVIGHKQKMQIDNLIIADALDMLCCSSGNKVMLWKISNIFIGIEKIEKKRNCEQIEERDRNKKIKLSETSESPQIELSVVKELGKKKKKKKKRQQVQSRSERAQFFDGLL